MAKKPHQVEHLTAKITLLVLGLFAVCVFTAFSLATRNVMLVSGVVVAIGMFVFGFLSPRIALYLLIFSMLLSPEIGSRDLSGKGFTIRFEDILLLVMSFSWLAKSALIKNVGFVTRTPLNTSIFSYVAVCIVSTSLGILEGTVTSPATGFLFVLKYFEYFVVFFLTVNNVHTREELRNLLIAIFVTYLIVLVVGLIQIPRGERISAPFEGQAAEPNTLGGYLLIMFSLTITLLFSITGVIRRSALGLLAFLCFIAILFTLSRATWLGFVPLYFVLIVFVKQRNTLIFGLIFAIAIVPLALPQTVIDRFTYTFSGQARRDLAAYRAAAADMTDEQIEFALSKGVGFDSSTNARLDSMRKVVRDFINKPLLGYGVTGYEFIDAQYHRVLIETGFFGLIAFLFMLRSIGKNLRDIRRKYHGNPLYNTLTTGTYCAFIGLIFHAIGTNTFIIVRIMEPLWCLLGLCMAIPIIEGKAASPASRLSQ